MGLHHAIRYEPLLAEGFRPFARLVQRTVLDGMSASASCRLLDDDEQQIGWALSLTVSREERWSVDRAHDDSLPFPRTFPGDVSRVDRRVAIMPNHIVGAHMTNMRLQHLFLSTSLSVVFDMKQRAARDAIEEMSLKDVTERSLDDIVNDLVSIYSLEIATIDGAGASCLKRRVAFPSTSLRRALVTTTARPASKASFTPCTFRIVGRRTASITSPASTL